MKKSNSAFLIVALGGLFAFALSLLVSGASEFSAYFVKPISSFWPLVAEGSVCLVLGLVLSLLSGFLLAHPHGKNFAVLLLLYFLFFALQNIAIGAIGWADGESAKSLVMSAEMLCCLNIPAVVLVLVLLLVSPKHGKPFAILFSVLVGYLFVSELTVASMQAAYYHGLRGPNEYASFVSAMALMMYKIIFDLIFKTFFGALLVVGLFREDTGKLEVVSAAAPINGKEKEEHQAEESTKTVDSL